MRILPPLPLALSLLFLICCIGQAYADETPGSCPVSSPEELRALSESSIQAHCARAERARAAAESFPNTFQNISLCKNSLRMARENARVTFAANERRATGFEPEKLENITQEKSFEKAAELLLAFHNYSNISLAATYRSRLKLRKFAGRSEKAEQQISIDIRRLENATSPRRNGQYLKRKQRQLEMIRELRSDVRNARACLEAQKEPLNRAFEEWAGLKRSLLQSPFSKFVSKTGAAGEREYNLGEADRLQNEQQYVYDVLTNPSKRDWAYNLAEGCQQNSCDKWSPAFGAAEWSARVSGYISRTPVLGGIIKIIAGGLAGDLAKRQGLTFWQQVKEALNGITPFGLDLVDTEVRAMERGEVRVFTGKL